MPRCNGLTPLFRGLHLLAAAVLCMPYMIHFPESEKFPGKHARKQPPLPNSISRSRYGALGREEKGGGRRVCSSPVQIAGLTLGRRPPFSAVLVVFLHSFLLSHGSGACCANVFLSLELSLVGVLTITPGDVYYNYRLPA
ncbi:hypothetical protein GGS23DRAFT_543498 [Durotheca rogersii]|uniref:uncharacterized protein n=1 Tax=Durotheca rogersii TaxID=419775 RepID=UPI00221F0416|nr:uncharacterized protein GGS23DRAFT_543498 [Durotheca rogersii]KAI5867990.1 hypothetical protein GGS23DRAFT_543498 [Durotheca rogersii]